jgi:hypothetical protein
MSPSRAQSTTAVMRPPTPGQVQTYAGHLGKVSGAEAKPNRNYIERGSYTGVIERCTEGTTRNGKPYFVADFRITAASADSVTPEGDVVSWFINLAFEGSERDVRGLMNAVCTDAEIDRIDDTDPAIADEFFASVTGNAQVLKGRTLRLQATRVKTKAGGDFTKVACFSASQESLPGVE